MNTKNPYPGLRAFEFEESHLFFGREGQCEELLDRLQHNHFVAVVGTSGSGKSSFVKAGLLPLLYGGFMADAGANWHISIFRPGKSPIRNLATTLVCPTEFESQCIADGKKEFTAEEKLKITVTETILRRSSIGLLDYATGIEFDKEENLLIVVDQFEELFRFKDKLKQTAEDETAQSSGDDEAAAFVKLLLEATRDKASRIYVVITMRSDFLGDCAQFRNLPEAINDEGQYLIPRLMRDQLRQVIEAPAKVHRVQMTPALVTRLLNDIGDDQDQLPVLQHALMRTWQKWLDEPDLNVPLDITHYESIGGMATALSVHANKAYNELKKPKEKFPSERQIIAEKLFKCLTVIDNENREVRRATTLANICTVVKGTDNYSEADYAQVVSVVNEFRRLGRTFLMPPFTIKLDKNSLLDISHESLIRKWDTLKKWVDEEAKWAHMYRRLAEDAFVGTNFWGGAKLKETLDWREKFNPNKTWARLYYESWGQEDLSDFDEAMEFLNESKRREDAEIAEKERTTRILRIAVAGLCVVLLLSIGLTIYAFQQKQNIDSLLKEQKKATEEITHYNNLNYENAKKLKEINDELTGKKKEAEEAKDSLQEKNDALNEKTEQLVQNEEKLKTAFTKQQEAAEIAKRAQEKAELSEAEKIKAFEIQRNLAEKEEKARKKFEKMATREKLNRDGLTSLEKGQNDLAFDQFTDLLANYKADAEIEPTDKTEGEWWALHNLGTINWQRREFSDAEKNYKDALETLGETKEQIDSLSSEQKFPTENIFQKVAYQAANQESDKNTRSKLATLQRLGKLNRYRAQSGTGRKDFIKFNLQATKSYQRLLEILESGINEDPLYLAAVKVELADTYLDLTNNDFARKYYDEALEIFNNTPGKQNLYSIISIEENLSKVDLRDRDFKEAKARIRKTIELRRTNLHLPLHHPDMAASYNSLGEIYIAESDALIDNYSYASRQVQDKNQSQPQSVNQDQRDKDTLSEELSYKAQLYFALSGAINVWNGNGKKDKSDTSDANEWNETDVTVTKDSYDYDKLAKAFIEAGECKKAGSLYFENLTNKNESANEAVIKLILIAKFYKDKMLDDVNAKKYYLKIADKLLEPNFPVDDSIDEVLETNDFLYEKGNYEQADKIYNRLLAELEKSGDVVTLTTVYVNIAHNKEMQKVPPKEVNAIYEKAVKAVESKIKDTRENSAKHLELLLADVLIDQADFNFRQKDTTLTLNILERAMPIYTKHFTFSDTDAYPNWYEEYFYCLQMLGDMKRENKDNIEAVKYYEQALKASDIFGKFLITSGDIYPDKISIDFYNKRMEFFNSWASLLTGEARNKKLKEAKSEERQIKELKDNNLPCQQIED